MYRDTTYYCGWFFTMRVVVLCCVTTDAMCTSTSTQQYKTINLLLHTASMNEPTDMYIRCLLYLKMRNIYQMTLVLSSNDNYGYWHHSPSTISNRLFRLHNRLMSVPWISSRDKFAINNNYDKGSRKSHAVYRLVTAPQGGTQNYTLAFAYDFPRWLVK